MNKSVPRTPLSTHLSRSARETEIRIRNIFSGPKKRPPVLLMILIASLILLCGNLVAFRPLPVKPTLVMETQYYDLHNNYVEIPALALPAGEKNEAVEAINEALNDLRGQYSGPLSGSGDFWEEQCLFYPSTTNRYLNLLFYRDNYTTDLNTGHVFSLVYDLKEGTLVSAEDALARAGLNEKGLLDQATGQILTLIAQDAQEYDLHLALYDLTIEGFRIKADGQPVFYLTGRIDDVDDAVRDDVSGADYLYIWEDRAVTTYDQYSGKPSALVPAEETDKLDPPLWNQWFFANEGPAGGFVDTSALEPAAELYDPEVCLYRDGFTTPIGPGNWADLFPEFEPDVVIHEDWEPTYQPGDYWDEWSIGSVYAVRYYNAGLGSWSINDMSTTRTDLFTPQGIRVGSTRDEVLAAYPSIHDEPYGGDVGTDYLWYGNDNGLGSALLFNFTDDKVDEIVLCNISD